MIVPPSLYPVVFDPTGSLKTDIRQGLRSHGYATINSHMIGINNSRVSDVHLRRAMNHAVNRRQIVDRLLYGQGEPMVGTVPAGTRGYIPPFDVDATFDLTLARAELKRSNYRGESIEMLVHEQAGSEQIGQIFSEQMRAIGVNINLVKVDFNSAIGRMIGGNTQLFSMYLDYVYSAPEGILMAVFPSEKRPAPNFWQFSNTEADAALEGLRSSAPNEANQKAANVERLVMEQVPALFLFRARQTVLYSERFGDLTVNQHGHFAFDRLGAASK